MDDTGKNELEQLYRRYARPLYFYLLKMSGSPQLAEDLTQETFVRATVLLSAYRREEARAWLFKVARNAYLDEWRKRKRWKWFFKQEMISPYGLPEEEVLKEEEKRDLMQLLSYLPEQYRTIIYLREYEAFSYEEIQEALDLSPGQVKVTLHRARKRLAQLAEKKGWRIHDDGVD